MSGKETYAERILRSVDELDEEWEEIKKYARRVAYKMNEEGVGFQDPALIERDREHLKNGEGTLGKLGVAPKVQVKRNRNHFYIDFSLDDIRVVEESPEEGEDFHLKSPTLPSDIQALPGDYLYFKDDAISRLENKYGISVTQI